jgi:hypothetical protein
MVPVLRSKQVTWKDVPSPRPALPQKSLSTPVATYRVESMQVIILIMGPRGASNRYIFEQASRGALFRSDLAWCGRTRRYLFLCHFYRCEKAQDDHTVDCDMVLHRNLNIICWA